MKNATSTSEIAGVYWSTRDMSGSPLGNHHFITFIYESEDQAKRVTQAWNTTEQKYYSEENDKGLTIYYTTMGGSSDTGWLGGKLIFHFNPGSDREAIHEIAKEDNTSWYKADWDYEGRRVPYDQSSQGFTSNEQLMQAVLQRVMSFNEHYAAGESFDYDLLDSNCATAVNTLFRVLGYSNSVREELGESWGIDWGEEDLIPDSLFSVVVYIGNIRSKELHVPTCVWVARMKERNKVQFTSIAAALAQGYNGCAFCLYPYDTDTRPVQPSDRCNLKLKSIKCHETEDWTGPDDAYLRANEVLVWGPVSMNNDDTEDLSGVSPISFQSSVRLVLYDQDDVDADDNLGSKDVLASEAGKGEQTCSFKGDGANYTLTYTVEKAWW